MRYSRFLALRSCALVLPRWAPCPFGQTDRNLRTVFLSLLMVVAVLHVRQGMFSVFLSQIAFTHIRLHEGPQASLPCVSQL
jgi:hypothetical protein